jgi:dipeptidyl aminopeptidase/acylaminoacyl peptidase
MLRELNVRDDAPWKQRYRAASIAWAKVATRNPARGLVCTNRDGIYQLYAWDVASGALTRLTDKPAGVVGGMIDARGEYVYYHDDLGGNEIGHYVRVPFTGGAAQDVTPDLPPYASFQIVQSHDGHVTGFLAASQGTFTLYVMGAGEAPRAITTFTQLTFGPIFSHDGGLALVDSSERTRSLDTSLMAYDTITGELVNELWDGEGSSHNFASFSPLPDDARVLATSSKSGYERPLIWNPRTGERHDIAAEGIPGELTPWAWSPDARTVLLCQLNQAVYQLYRYDVATRQMTKLEHPAGAVGSAEYLQSGDIMLTWQDPAHPPRLITLDGASGAQKQVLLTAGAVPAGWAWRSVSFTGAGGDTIQAWLGTPDGGGPFPTILHMHGGPTSVMSDFYAPGSQAWLDHGFAFLTINYHGSTTFGKPFEKSIWGNLGNPEVEDMVAAYHWLVAQGIAQPDAVLLTGGSYGGYLTLQAIGRAPQHWAGGMAVVAIADWRLMYEDQAETLRAYQRALFGGTPDETPQVTASASPITYAEQVRAPILVIQGSNDTRCPARQMRAYEERLTALGKQIQVHWFDAGHGSRAMEQQIEQQELMLRFAYRVLG